MAETVGSLIDKLSIVELRRWHTEEAMLNPGADPDVRHECAMRLAIIDEQRADLVEELDALWAAIARGEHVPKVYRQLKMYNDQRLREAPHVPPTAESDPEPTAMVIPFVRRRTTGT